MKIIEPKINKIIDYEIDKANIEEEFSNYKFDNKKGEFICQ